MKKMSIKIWRDSAVVLPFTDIVTKITQNYALIEGIDFAIHCRMVKVSKKIKL